MSYEDVTQDDAREDVLNLLGMTYGELSKIDKNIVSPTSQTGLHPASHMIKQQIIRFADSQIQTRSPIQQQQPQQLTGAANSVVPHLPVTTQQVKLDTNQLEFNFDNSATAVSIQNKLDKLSDDVRRVLGKLNQLIEAVS